MRDKNIDGAQDMLLADNVDDNEYLTGLFEIMYDELPERKVKNSQ